MATYLYKELVPLNKPEEVNQPALNRNPEKNFGRYLVLNEEVTRIAGYKISF